ncbi:hypothetical protein ACMA1D_23485 [Streptomyces sp. 796.1]|uniref:hypothetical protein n=1 Tax=Streptomyces sp. 796.1 TaxID=3163029 RepID=UPI0039C92D57
MWLQVRWKRLYKALTASWSSMSQVGMDSSARRRSLVPKVMISKASSRLVLARS